MNIPINPLPENSPDISRTSKSGKKLSGNNISFSSQLSGMVNERKKAEKQSNQNDSISGYSPLNSPQNTTIGSLLNNNSVINEKTGAKLASLLEKTRQQLMSGIKKSISKIEDSINNNPDIEPKLREDYENLIVSLKEDFSSGFGVDYNTFRPAANDDIQNLTEELKDEVESLSPAIRKVIEENII